MVDSKKHVNKKLLEYLSLDVPSKKLVSETMSSIAKEYDIDWSPSPEDLNEEPDFEPVKRTSFVIPKGKKDEIKSMDEYVDRVNDDRSSGTDPNSDGKMSTPPQYSPKNGKREVDDELEDLEARFHALKSK